MKRKLRPNVVSGGSALALGDNFYLMKGKTHKQGGIDIGKNPKAGIEVENNEVVQVTPNNIRVFSAQPILGGISPAQALLYGGNPQHIFNAQETWKQVNRVTDDGKRFGPGGVYTPSKEIIDYIKKTEAFRDKWYKDGNGIDTIGYGFTGSEVKRLFPNGITREQADKYFADSIARRAAILAKDTPNWDSLTQNQRDALLSYHYNVGEGSYRNKHKNLQAALTNKDWDKVIANMDAGYNDKKNPGLRKRRDYERDLFRSGSVTSLTGEEEDAFQNWYGHYSQAHRLNANPDAKEHYYDYRGYWKNRTKEDEQNELIFDSHLPDTYKLPGHPTFSRESKYSTRRTPGGTWQKIGLGPIYDEQFVDSKYTKRLKTFQNAQYKMGGIHIKPSKRGTFTAAAKRHHMSVQEFARKVLNNRAHFSAAMVKKANFARNASKWHKKEFGGDMTRQYYITPNNIYKLGGQRPKALFGDNIPITKTKINGRDAWDVNGRIVYSEAEAYRLAGMIADIQGTLDMSGPIDSSIVYADKPIRDTLKTNDNIIPIEKIKVNGKDAWDVDGKIVYNESDAYRLAGNFANARGSVNMSDELDPPIVTADRIIRPQETARPSGYRTNTIGFTDQIAGVPTVTPNGETVLPEQQTYNPPTQRTKLSINTSGRPTTNILGITPLRPYDGQQTDSTNRTRLPIDTSGRPTARAIGFAQLRPYDGSQIETPTSETQSSSTGGQRRNSNRPTASSVPIAPVIPIDYDAIDTQINNENNRILRNSLSISPVTPTTKTIPTTPGVSIKETIKPATTAVPKNPYYSKVNVGLHKVGAAIKDNPDLLGLGINWAGNLAASLINRSAIKRMKYTPAPIPLRAEKLPTKVNVNPQVSELKESAGYQEGLVKDNTASSAVSLARRQRIRNNASRQYQSLMGDKSNTELQLLTADKLNRQGVDAQNVAQYNKWREGAYDFENKRKEMLAENSVAGINNAAEAFAGPQGYLARKEARDQNLLNAAMIAATSPNAQKVIGSKEFEEWLRSMGYRGRFSLLNKTFNV